MTFTYSHRVRHSFHSFQECVQFHEIRKNIGDLIWKPNTFQVFSCAGFSIVYVERVRGVVDTSNATMVNSPEKKDVY